MPENVNLAQDILDALAETGIPFAEDAWFDENAEDGRKDYGVVKIVDDKPLYGDDQIILQHTIGSVILYVMDGKDEKAKTVQAAMNGVEGISIALTGKEFLQDLKANRWTWRFELGKGLI